MKSLAIVSDIFKISETSAIAWSKEVEGNVALEGRMVLGLRAGPDISVFNLIHEMSHLLEIDQERMFLTGWGLQYGTPVVIAGHEYCEPVTSKACLREVRVFAIQKVLSQPLGENFCSRYAANLIVDWVNGYVFLPGTTSEEKKLWCETEIDRLAAEHSFENLLDEWFKRFALFQKAFEKGKNHG